MEIKICGKCEHKNESDADLCMACGASLRNIEPTELKTSGESNLAPCPDCGRQISTKARACPGCGRPTAGSVKEDKAARRNKRGNVQGLGCLLIILSLFAIVISPFTSSILGIIGFIILVAGFFI